MSIIVGVTRTSTIGDLIASFLAQTIDDWEAILVCQRGAVASCDDPRVRVVTSERTGRSAALNDARALAAAPLLAITDDDCEVAADWLEVALECFDADPQLGYLGGSVIAPPRTARISMCPQVSAIEARYVHSVDGPDLPAGFEMIGANVFVRASVFDLVDGFDETIGAGTYFAAAEDLDFGVRIKHTDTKIGTTPRLVVHHTHGERAGLRAALRHQLAFARGSGAYIAKVEPTRLEPGLDLSWIPIVRRPGFALRHWMTHPTRIRAYRRYQREVLAEPTG